MLKTDVRITEFTVPKLGFVLIDTLYLNYEDAPHFRVTGFEIMILRVILMKRQISIEKPIL